MASLKHGPADLAPVVQKMDSAIHQINRYPWDKNWGNQLRCAIQWIEIYLVDSAIHLLNDWCLKFEVTNGHLYWSLAFFSPFL